MVEQRPVLTTRVPCEHLHCFHVPASHGDSDALSVLPLSAGHVQYAGNLQRAGTRPHFLLSLSLSGVGRKQGLARAKHMVCTELQARDRVLCCCGCFSITEPRLASSSRPSAPASECWGYRHGGCDHAWLPRDDAL
jgi:hypothetical protein